MSNAPIVLDTREFKKALVQFAAASKKDGADICNHALGNWAFRAAQFVKRSSKGKIDADISRMKGTGQWYALLTRMMQGGGQKIHLRRKAKGAEANVDWIDPATGQVRHGRKTLGFDRSVGVSSRKADKKRLESQIIRRRKATVNSFVAVFSWVAAKFKPLKVTKIGGKNFYKVLARKATPTKLEAVFTIPFKVNRKYPDANNEANVNGKVRIANAAMQSALNFVTQDLLVYAYGKMGKTAAKYSAKGTRDAILAANKGGR